MVGWSIPSSSVSDPTWTPAGPGRSRPSPSSPPPFARASAAVWNFFAVVVVVAAGGEAGTAGDASRLFLLDLDLLCEGPRSRGAGIGPGRSSSSAASGGGADSSSRGTRSWTAADPGVSAASFPALFSSSRWTGAGVATRDATAGFGGRSSRTSPAEGPRAAGTARGGDRARRGSLGGAHQRRGLRPRVSRVGRGDHLGVGDRDPATAAGLPGVVVVVGGGGGLGVKAPLGLGGACGVERWELSRVQVRGLVRRGGRGARSPRVNVVVVLVHARAPAGLVEALGGVGRAIAPRLGRHGGGRRDDASGSRGISPPSPRGAVCGSWRARLFPET